MGTSAQQCSLGWADFDSSLKHAVKGLRSRGDLVDVTLSAGGRSFPAHKVVLSAASSLFLELLRVTQCQHPIILLAGIGAAELEQVLDFVYTGEVSVHPTQLTALLQAAHVLCIRGLLEGSITAEEPDLQDQADAALAASSEAGQKVNEASLAAATKMDILSTVSRSGLSCYKRKSKDCDYRDCHNKWTKFESEDDVSDMENTPKETHTITVGTQTAPEQTHVSQTTQQIIGGLTEAGLKSQTDGTGCIDPSSPSFIKPDLSVSKSLHKGVTNPILFPPDNARDASLINDSNLMPCYQEDDKDESYGDIRGAADAAALAALAAATLADKKGLSDQPAACPVCNAVIRQSRNLRRHLKLKHFGKQPKVSRGGKRKTSVSQCDTDDESNAGSLADTPIIEHVQVEMKRPSVCDMALPSVSTTASTGLTRAYTSKLHTSIELLSAHQYSNVDACLHQHQLQLQKLDSLHQMAPASTASTCQSQIPYPHPHPHPSILRGDPHAILGTADSLAFRIQQ